MRVRVNNLNYSYGTKVVLKNLSFSLDSGDSLAIIGRNGAGKSTLIKCILKLLKVPNGIIYLDDIDINEIKKFHNLAYVPQKPEFNYEFPITVRELLNTSYAAHRHDTYFKNMVNAMQLNQFYNENINNLSGGQLQKVFVTRALIARPKLIILDEPTVGMDKESLEELKKIIQKLKEEKITIIFVTHDTDFGYEFANCILKFEGNFTYSFTKKESEEDVSEEDGGDQ